MSDRESPRFTVRSGTQRARRALAGLDCVTGFGFRAGCYKGGSTEPGRGPEYLKA